MATNILESTRLLRRIAGIALSNGSRRRRRGVLKSGERCEERLLLSALVADTNADNGSPEDSAQPESSTGDISQAQGPIYDEVPELTPEQAAMMLEHEQQPLLSDGVGADAGNPELIDDGSSPEVSLPVRPGDALSADAESSGIEAAGDFEIFRHRVVRPSGGSFGDIGDPSVGSLNNVVFQTGSWFASISEDNGQTFRYVSPYSTFPSSWGGFSHDQRVAHVPGRDMVLWYLQYRKTGSGTNDTNGVRVAFADTTSELANNSWNHVSFTPASFGLGQGKWLESPSMQVSNNYVYFTSNVFRTDNNAYVTSVWWKVGLTDLQNGGSYNYWYWTQSGATLGLPTGMTDTGYAAAVRSFNTTRIFTWPESTNRISWVDKGNLRATYFGTHTSYDNQGKNWTARSDSRIQTGYVSGNQLAFYWNSAQNSGSRPKPFVRGLVVDRNTKSVISQPDIWHSTATWHYPAFAVNTRGDVAGVIGVNGQNGPVATHILIDDDYTSGWQSHWGHEGTTGTGINGWGDFLGAQRDDQFGTTWIASGFTSNGTTNEPRFFWFGRRRDNPGANLVGESFNVIEEPRQPGQSLTADFTVLNEGARTAGSSRVDFYISTNNFFSISDRKIGSATIGSLSKGARRSGSATLTLPGTGDGFWTTLSDRNYYIGMIVDAGFAVPEYSGSDNKNRGEFRDWDTVRINYEDLYEQNDFAANAIEPLGPGVNWEQRPLSQISGLGVTRDADWYKIQVAPAGYERVLIDATFTDADGDIDIALYDSTGTTLLASSTSVTDNEQIDYIVSGPGAYLIKVYGYQGAVNTYDLRWDDLVLPDLAPILVDANPQGVDILSAGSAFEVDYEVDDLQFASFPAASYDLGFYLSDDNVIDPASDLLLTTVSGLTSASHSGTISAALPADIAPGNYFVGLYVDNGFTLREYDESNNMLVDDITISGDPPVIVGAAAPQTYVENRSARLLDPGVSVSDPDSADFNDGSVNVGLINPEAGDELVILQVNGVSVSGSDILVEGMPIGTWADDGAGGLRISLSSSDATPDRVTKLLRAIAFQNTLDHPRAGLRDAQLTLTDGTGAESAPHVQQISVVPTPDRPVVSDLGGPVTFIEDAGPVRLTSTGTLTDPDQHLDWGGAKLNVRVSRNLDSFDRLSISDQGLAPGQIGVSGNDVFFEGVRIGTFNGGQGTRRLQVNLIAGATTASVQALIRAIQFENLIELPAVASKDVMFELTDPENMANQVIPDALITVIMQGANDAPSLSGIDANPQIFREGGTPRTVGTGAVIADADYNGNGFLRVIPNGGESSDRLSVLHLGMGTNQVGVVGNRIYYSGTLIGNKSGGVGSNPLQITFNGNATRAAVQAVTRLVQFSNVSEDPSPVQRQLSFVFNDGDGADSAPQVTRVEISPTNDATAIISFGSDVQVTRDTNVRIAPTVVVSDVDSPNFDGGLFRATISNGRQAGDALSLFSDATVSAVGSDVFYAGTLIGTVGTNADSLTVLLNANATAAVVQRLGRNLEFRAAAAGIRSIRYQVLDGDGGNTITTEKAVHVT